VFFFFFEHHGFFLFFFFASEIVDTRHKQVQSGEQRDSSALDTESALKFAKYFQLTLSRQQADHLQQLRDGECGWFQEGSEMHEGTQSHDHLTVHAVSDASMAGQDVRKVLHTKGTLHAAGKEAPERCDDGRKQCKQEGMNVNRLQRHFHPFDGHVVFQELSERAGQVIVVIKEHRVHDAFQSLDLNDMEFRNGTREPFELRQESSEPNPKDDGNERSADEPLPGLVRRECQKRFVDDLFPPLHSHSVCREIVDDDQGDGQQEPDQAIEDVEYEHGCLRHHDRETRYGPCHLSELIFVASFPQREHEPAETENVQREADPEVVLDEATVKELGQRFLELTQDRLAVHVKQRDAVEEPVLNSEKGYSLVSYSRIEITYFDDLSKDHRLSEDHQQHHVEVVREQDGRKDREQHGGYDSSLHQFLQKGLSRRRTIGSTDDRCRTSFRIRGLLFLLSR